jgi:hypothetical protein
VRETSVREGGEAAGGEVTLQSLHVGAAHSDAEGSGAELGGCRSGGGQTRERGDEGGNGFKTMTPVHSYEVRQTNPFSFFTPTGLAVGLALKELALRRGYAAIRPKSLFGLINWVPPLRRALGAAGLGWALLGGAA